MPPSLNSTRWYFPQGAQGIIRWKKKALNLNTHKFRSPGDYVRTIRLSDCTDPFSTQLVSVYLHCVWLSIDSNVRRGQHIVLSIAFVPQRTGARRCHREETSRQ
jgi:hypothetical protein